MLDVNYTCESNIKYQKFINQTFFLYYFCRYEVISILTGFIFYGLGIIVSLRNVVYPIRHRVNLIMNFIGFRQVYRYHPSPFEIMAGKTYTQETCTIVNQLKNLQLFNLAFKL